MIEAANIREWRNHNVVDPAGHKIAQPKGGVRVMVLFLLLIIVAVALGIIGTVTEGLGYLLFIGIVLLAADLLFATMRLSGGTRRRPPR